MITFFFGIKNVIIGKFLIFIRDKILTRLLADIYDIILSQVEEIYKSYIQSIILPKRSTR